MTSLTLVSDDEVTSGPGGVVSVIVTVSDSTTPVFKSADGQKLRGKKVGGNWTASWVAGVVGDYPIIVTAGNATPVTVDITVEGGSGPAPDPRTLDTLVREFYAIDDSMTIVGRWRAGRLDLKFQVTELATASAVNVLPVGWRPDIEVAMWYFDPNEEGGKRFVIQPDGTIYTSAANFGSVEVEFTGVNATKVVPALPYPGSNVPF